MTEFEDELFELRAIKRILSIAHSDKLDVYLNEVITTHNRRKMWIALDGQRLPNDIAKEVGVSAAAVTYFLKTITDARLVEYEQGKPPRKIIDHVPTQWLEDPKEDKES